MRFCVADEDALDNLSSGCSLVGVSSATVEQLTEIASTLEKGAMNGADFEIQSKFLLSRLLMADSSSDDTVSRQDYHRTQRELRESEARAKTAQLSLVQTKNECAQLKKENEEINKNVNGWYAQVEELKPKLAEVEKGKEMAMFPLTQKIDYLQTQLDTSKTKCTGLESRVETLSAGKSMDEDAVIELQNAIEEAEGLYKQIEVLEKQVQEQHFKAEEQAENIVSLETEITRNNVKLQFSEQEVLFLRKKVEFSNEGYRDAKLETRNQQHEIEALRRQVHDFDFRILSMDAERAIVVPRLTEDERAGLTMLGLAVAKPNTGAYNKAEELAGMVSRLANLATEHKRKVDLEWEDNKEIMNQIKNNLAAKDAEVQELKKQLQQLKIEAGTAKFGRNQFVQLSRDLDQQLKDAVIENEANTDYYLKEMKFFSDQYASLKQTDTALRTNVDLPTILDTVKELEIDGGSAWEGVQDDVREFSEMLSAPKSDDTS